MKKVLAVVIATIMMALCLTGCTSVKSDLEKYCANEDIQKVMDIINEATDLVDEAGELEEEDIDASIATVKKAKAKADEAVELVESIKPKTDEVKEAHQKFIDTVKSYDEYVGLLVEFVELEKKGDYTAASEKMNEFYSKVEEYSKNGQEFAESLLDLVEEQEADVDTKFLSEIG